MIIIGPYFVKVGIILYLCIYKILIFNYES